MGKTYSLNFTWIGNNYFVQQGFNKPLARGTKLAMTITAPNIVTSIQYLAGISTLNGSAQFQWLNQGKDYTFSGNKININTTINSDFDWAGFTTAIVSSQAGNTGSYTLSEATFVGGGSISAQTNWKLTNSVGNVIKKTNDFKITSISYGNYTVMAAYNFGNVGGLMMGGKDKSTGNGYPSNTDFSGIDIIDIGTYPIYNLVDNSSGLGPTTPTGGAEAGINNWNPTYSSTVYNPVTGSAVIDVSGQGNSIQLFYPISYSGNSWKNGIIFTFFVKVSSNYTGSDSPFNFIGVNLNSRVLNDDSNVDGGTTSFTSPDLSSLNSKWFAGYWYEIAFFISDVSSLPSRELSGVGFNLGLNSGGIIQYFSDPGVYPGNYWASFEPGFLIPSVG